MRPAGDISQALIRAAGQLAAASEKGGATLAEIAAKACVGRDAARHAVSNLKRHGHLAIVGEQRVHNRNRPVALYAPPDPDAAELAQQGADALAHCMQAWGK